MLKVVTSNNTAIFRELRSASFQAVGVSHVVATSGPDALAKVRSERPALVILDVDLPELSGYEVCKAIKQDAALAGTRVLLVVSGSPTPAEVDRLADAGCDDIMTIPLPADNLYTHAARLLALPIRQRSHVRAQVLLPETSKTPVLRGEASKISTESLEVTVEQAVDVGTEVRLRLARVGQTSALVVKGKVVACEGQERTRVLRIKLAGLRPEDERMLADLGLWEVLDRGDNLQVVLRGDITERTEFNALRDQLAGLKVEIVFDLSAVRYMNSTGIRRWVEFLEALDERTSYSFVRCSVGFTTQLSLVDRAAGRGRIVSFLAPYRCEVCDRESEHLIKTSDLQRAEGKPLPDPPRFECATCGEGLVLDEMPERFFAFLA